MSKFVNKWGEPIPSVPSVPSLPSLPGVPSVPGNIGVPVDTGGPLVTGSIAKSPYQYLIPPQLNTLFTSDVLLPAQYSVVDAIEQVIDCNCDCWLQ